MAAPGERAWRRRLLGAAVLTASLTLLEGAVAKDLARESFLEAGAVEAEAEFFQDSNAGRRFNRGGPFVSSPLALAAHDKDGEARCSKDNTGLLSASVACCYQKLVKDPGCCLDQEFTPGVTRRWIERPNTEWACQKKTGCFDGLYGKRGKDIMWIPEGADCDSPRVLYIHGGSWMYGSPNTTGYPQFGSRMAAEMGAVVFVIDYPLIPYGNYSTILEAAVVALKWLGENGPSEKCRGKPAPPLFVGGDSSGGGSAMSVVLHLNAEPRGLKGPKLSGGFMFSPWTNLMCNTPEYYTNAFAKITSPGTFKDLTALQLYTGDIIFQSVTTTNADEFSANAVLYIGRNQSLQTDPIASSYFAEPSHFSGPDMPPLHISVGGSESILGDSVRVAQAAARGGAEVTVEIYSGMWHVFPMYSEGCGSGEVLWSAAAALKSTAAFVKSVAAKPKGEVKLSMDGNPRIIYMYDPMVDIFDRVAELMPYTSASDYLHGLVKKAEEAPWYIVLPAMIGSTTLIFVAGCLTGALTDFGGREAYKRAKRISDYRQQFIEVPVGYVNLDALHELRKEGEKAGPPRSFIADFILGVPDESVQASWRVETAKNRHNAEGESTEDGEQSRVEAARRENAAWRRMAMGTYQPPPTPEKVEQTVEEFKEEVQNLLPADELVAQVAGNENETWAASTIEAKDGGIEAARRENMAFRMQHMRREKGASPDE